MQLLRFVRWLCFSLSRSNESCETAYIAIQSTASPFREESARWDSWVSLIRYWTEPKKFLPAVCQWQHEYYLRIATLWNPFIAGVQLDWRIFIIFREQKHEAHCKSRKYSGNAAKGVEITRKTRSACGCIDGATVPLPTTGWIWRKYIPDRCYSKVLQNFI